MDPLNRIRPARTFPSVLDSGQANGGNSSYLQTKPELPDSTQKSTPFNAWLPTPAAKSAGDVGLANLGNTCFLNSGLQCLLHSGGLVEYFLNCKFKDNGSCVFALLQSFQIVIQQVWSGKHDSLHLNEFRNVLGGIHPQFKDGRQHDCQEFLGFTLDAIHEQLKKWHADEAAVLGQKNQANSSQEVQNTANDNLDKKQDLENFQAGVNTQSDETQVNCNGTFDNSEEVSSSTSPTPASPAPTIPTIHTNIRSQAKFGRKKAGRKATPSLHKSRTLNASQNKKALNVKQSPLIPADAKISTNGSCESLVNGQNSGKKPKEEFSSDEETLTKKVRVDEEVTNQDDRMEVDEAPDDNIEENGQNAALSLQELKEKVHDYWAKHISENNTVIASTFQGVFKSTVICSECEYVSITYEPFMYLSVPIPRITTKDLKIKLVDVKDSEDPRDICLTLDLTDNVAKLKEEVMKKLGKDPLQIRSSDYFVSEVANNYVTRYLEDNVRVRDINDSRANIYMYELNSDFNLAEASADDPIQYATFYAETEQQQRELIGRSYLGDEEDWDADVAPIPPLVEVHEGNFSADKYSSTFVPPSDEKSTETTEPVLTCAEENPLEGNTEYEATCCICLENDPNLDFRKHMGCGCVVCKDCVKRGSEHYNSNKENSQDPSGVNYIKCPRCMEIVEHVKEFVPFKPNLDPYLRMQLITIVFRCDSDTNNNSASSRLFGTPYIVKIPSCLPTSQFNEFIAGLNVFGQRDVDYKVVIVDTKGTRCAHCVYTDECPGCEILIRERDGNISLSAINTLAICYSNLSEEDISEVDPVDMIKGSPPSMLYSPAPWLSNMEPQVDIYDCLATFSESESLDEQNGWFCPKCKKNQCATKSMSVCKFPDYLIVYLKRFVFIDNSSIKLNNKLSFPLNGLDLKPYISEECSDSDCVYDLYACVCHYGSASGGHYTAFGKNPVSQKWNHFNDTQVTANTPGESDYSSAYVLFYQRRGVNCTIPAPDTIKILSMYNPPPIACVVPYQKLHGPANSFLKNGPSQANGDYAEEIGQSVTSSSCDVPYMSPCDSSKRLKSTENIVTNGYLEDDEDQENHRPRPSNSKLQNGYDSGDGDSENGTQNLGLSLSRKSRRGVTDYGAGDSGLGSMES